MDKDLLTISQFAELMGVSRATVKGWREDGIAPPEVDSGDGKAVRFEKAAVLAWAEGRQAA